ncbi:MAG TPA: radical SAM protein [Dongiaceae bacterium]|nr:radical SAM protein [Dongiaceae bacterium]
MRTFLLPIRKLAVESLETPLTQHCNLRCAACDHASPFHSKSFLDMNLLARDLDVLSRVVRAEEFRLVGGEPLQHPELLSIIEVIRKARIAKRIVVVTNGMLIHKMDQRFWRAIDKVWLSIYPGVSLPLPLAAIEDLCREHDVEFAPRPTNEFRIALVNNRIDDHGLVKAIYRDCKTAHHWKCYTVFNGYFYKCSKASVMRERLLRLGIVREDSPRDGVDLRSRRRLKSRLQAYLRSQEPLASCQACLGTSGPLIPHRQLNADALRAAADEDHSALIDQMRQRHMNSIKRDSNGQVGFLDQERSIRP